MKVLTKEHREKIGSALRGREFSEEHRQKMGLAQTGEKNHQWRGGRKKFTCLNCQNEFWRYSSENGIHTFCSRKCAYQYRTKLPSERKCEYCGEMFAPVKNAQRFCNHSCSSKSALDKNNWFLGSKQTEEHIEKRVKKLDQTYNWKGGVKIQNGYRFIRIGRGRYTAEHRIIAERALGRSLKYGEMVHHINGDRTDNRNCNLLICTRGYHSFLNLKMASLYQKEHFSPKPIDYVPGVSQISESVSDGQK